MLLLLLRATFTALLLCGVSPLIVPPPENVTVSCQNLKTTVSWKYSSQQPGTRFRVEINGSAGYEKSETTDHQYDLSHFVWKSEDRYLGFHSVNVTAIQGGDQSKFVESQSFSFNGLKPVDITCFLDFPPVNLTVKEAVTTLSFPNPLHFDKELKQAVKPNNAYLEFIISTDNKTVNKCTIGDLTCKRDVSFPEGVEQCITLEGWLCVRNCIHKVEFNKTGPICAPPLDHKLDVHVIALSLMLGILLFVIIVATAAICKEKGWTMKTYDPLPSPLVNWDKQLQHCANDTTKETCSAVTVLPPDSSEDEDEDKDNYLSKDDDSRSSSSSLGFQSSDRLYEDRGHVMDEDSTGDSVKTKRVSIDLEKQEEDDENEGVEPVSSYNSPKNVQDIGNGEMVICYTWR